MAKPRGTRPGAFDWNIGQRAGTLSGVVVIAARFMRGTLTEEPRCPPGIFSFPIASRTDTAGALDRDLAAQATGAIAQARRMTRSKQFTDDVQRPDTPCGPAGAAPPTTRLLPEPFVVGNPASHP